MRRILPLLLVSSCSTFTIRQAVIPQDLYKIQECRQTAFEGKERLLASELSFLRADAAQRDSVACFVAERSNKIVGTLDLVTKSKRKALIRNVFVRPDCRGQGYAKELVQQAEASLDQGCVIQLDVDTNNTPAVSLYERMGFVPAGVVHASLQAIGKSLGLSLLMTMEKAVS